MESLSDLDESPYFPLSHASPGQASGGDFEFKESISRFKKALLRTVVYKRDLDQRSSDVEQTLDVNSSSGNLTSGAVTSQSLDVKAGVLPSSQSLGNEGSADIEELVHTQGPEKPANFSPIQTSPRLELQETIAEAWETGHCERCCSMRKALSTAKQRARQQDLTVGELTAQLSLAQSSVASLTADLAKLKAKYDGLFTQHLQVISDYKAALTACKELELKQTVLEVRGSAEKCDGSGKHQGDAAERGQTPATPRGEADLRR